MSEPTSPAPVRDNSTLRLWHRWADHLLAFLAVLFAFFAASFAAHNSDLWLHLATGRLIATGGYTFGVDPFSYMTEGIYWANHTWLSDLVSYLIHQSFGGSLLVVLKSLIVAATAVLMLRIGSCARAPYWVSTGCTILAVLAMSSRLLLQPTCISMLFLALSLYLLRSGGRVLISLPILIAFWVNIDSWFVLGPLLVVLYQLGQWLASYQTARAES